MRSILALSGLLIAAAGLAVPALAGSGKARVDYILHCSGCHGLTGAGTVEGGIPAFPDSVEHIAGLELGRDYILRVPGVVNTSLSDAEIAAVLNYILDEWAGGDPARFTAEEVALRRAKPARNVVQMRREIARDLRAAGVEIAAYPWP